MKMSMAKKIYAIVILLILMMVCVGGVGLYSVGALSDTMDNLARQFNRAIDMNMIDKVILQRRIDTTDLVASEDAATMLAMYEKNLAGSEAEMNRVLQVYKTHWDSPAPQDQIETERRIRDLWETYVRTTNEVARLSMENTNVAAMRASDSLDPFWETMDEELSNLAVTVANNGNDADNDVAPMIADVRVALTRFRVLVLRFIPEMDAARNAALSKQIHDTMDEIDAFMVSIVSKLKPEEGGTQAQRIASMLQNEAKSNIVKMVDLGERNSNFLAYQKLATEATPVRAALDSFTSERTALAATVTAESMQQASALASRVYFIMIATGAIGIVLSLAVAYIIISGIIRRLNMAIASLDEASSQVSAAAAQISDSSQSLAEGSTEQAASLEETSSALEEMASMTRQNADNASKTNENMRQTGQMLGEGSEHMEAMGAAMAEISDSSEQINRIIKTIEDIAFQTNLLALNAAVEAARAGEAGKGFAVVADEVRNLAQRSAQAARDTTSLIEGTIRNVQGGVDVSRRLAESFTGIQESATTVTRLVQDITSATNEQAQGVDQVNTAVAQMDKVTQGNAATAEETASAAEELSAQAQALTGIVQNLVAMVEGQAGPAGGANGPSPVRARVVPPRKQAPKASLGYSGGVRPTSSGGGQAKASGGVRVVPASEVIPLGEEDEF